MRKYIEAIGSVIAVGIAAGFIWLVLAAPGFVVDGASTVPLGRHQEARR